MPETIIFYDIPQKGASPKAWTPNPFKARLSLNYKGVPYKTQWVEYPDIAPTFKAKGIKPHSPEGAVANHAEYTCPAAEFTDGTLVMDSLEISRALEARHPEPSLHLDAPIVQRVREQFGKAYGPLAPEFIPQVPSTLLNPPSAEYFDRTRAARFGMPIAEYRKLNGGQKAFDAASADIAGLAAILKEDPSGPFFLGNTPSFADIIVVSFLEFLSRLNKDNFNQFVAHDAAFVKLWEASRKWAEKDD